MSGENNPYWGKTHSPEIRDKIKEGRRARIPDPIKSAAQKALIAKAKAEGTFKPGGKKGYKHTPEAKEAMSRALKERWATRRDDMIARLPRGEDHHWKKTGEILRHRVNFTPLHKKEWLQSNCFWCGSEEDLELDHIIPVAAGGTNEKHNAQTLCRQCNLFKAHYVDRPYYLAMLGSQGGRS